MKFSQQPVSNKNTRNLLAIIFIVLFLILNLISCQTKPKITRQIGSSSEDIQTLWTRKMFLSDFVVDWKSNTIYIVELEKNHLLAIDSLTGLTVWEAPLDVTNKNGELNQFGIFYLLAGDQAVFTITSSYVNAYRASTGELLWYTKLGDGHVLIYVQEEDPLLRIYYEDKIFEISQLSGEILSTQPKEDIVWIQNNIEVHCPLIPSQDGSFERCWVGLTGVDHKTGKILWKNNKPIFSEDYQEQSVNNMVFVEFPGEGICSLNPNTGEYAWCLPEGKISNFAIDHDGKTGYFIRHDFSLVKTNLLTDDILAETQFLPKVLPAGMQKDGYAYGVVVTKDTVIVSFGDSEQTFGLKFSQ